MAREDKSNSRWDQLHISRKGLLDLPVAGDEGEQGTHIDLEQGVSRSPKLVHGTNRDVQILTNSPL